MLTPNVKELCSKSESVSVGFSDYNLLAVARKVGVPKVGPSVLHQRSFISFCESDFIKGHKVGTMGLSVCNKQCGQSASVIHRIVADKHAPIRKFTIKERKPSWLDEE